MRRSCRAAELAYFGMANFRYLGTFIDEEPMGGELPRSRSCPHLGQQHADWQDSQHAATYVVELWQRAQTLTGMRVAPVQPVAVPVDADETESVPEEPVLPDMAATETVAAEADMLKTEIAWGWPGHQENVRTSRPAPRVSVIW